MSGEARYPILPSRMGLSVMKTRLKGAQNGHRMLKKKADAIQVRFRSIVKELSETKNELVSHTKQAQFSLCEARFFAPGGTLDFAIQESLKLPTLQVHLATESIAGVPTPKFSLATDSLEWEKTVSTDVVSLGQGGAHITRARQSLYELLSEYVRIASLQTAFIALDQALRKTNRRVNALEKVVIPKMIRTAHYIESELEEMGKEEFFRLKMVCKKKKQEGHSR